MTVASNENDKDDDAELLALAKSRIRPSLRALEKLIAPTQH